MSPLGVQVLGLETPPGRPQLSEPLVRFWAAPQARGPAASAGDEGLPECHLGGRNSLNRLLCD